MWRSFLQSM